MEVRAIAKSVKMSPRKVRLVADAIRELSIMDAYQVLESTQKRSGGPLMKTLQSAVANAINNNSLNENNLVISSIMVNEGQAMKRIHPSSRGRVHPYKKRSSHITIVLKEKAIKAMQVVKAGNKKQIAVKKVEDNKETTFVKTAKKGGNK